MRRRRAAEARVQMNEAVVPCVSWEGVFFGYSGYAKANREIAFRVANSVRLSIAEKDAQGPRELSEAYHYNRVSPFFGVKARSSAPHVRLFGPHPENGPDEKYRVIFTMMETEKVHSDFIEKMNENYDECWVPTEWNRRTFIDSGLKIPALVMPLGADPLIYYPGPKTNLPPCSLMTTENMGAAEVPKGFLFIYVCWPSYRKGVDLLMSAFEDAFADDADAGLVLATTHSGASELVNGIYNEKKKARVWNLPGSYTEHGLANIYRGCDAYLCTSRGEGWNLPMTEAAACDLPVILPRHSSHPEIVGGMAYLFDPDGSEIWPADGGVSPWYVGMPFPRYTRKTHDQLVSLLRQVKAKASESREKGAAFGKYVREHYTWDKAAANAVRRIVELNRH